MSDKPGFRLWSEEAGSQIVVRTVGREDECRVGVVQLARDREHLGLGQSVGVEHDARGISCEALAGECIYLVNLDLACHRFSSALQLPRRAILVLPQVRGAACSLRGPAACEGLLCARTCSRRKIFLGTK